MRWGRWCPRAVRILPAPSSRGGPDYGRTHQESDCPEGIEFEYVVLFGPRSGRQPFGRSSPEAAENWLLGGELEGVVSGRRKLKGAISPTPNGNIHDVWPGQWNFSDLAGVGGNIIFGRRLGDGFSQVYLFGGRRRMSTEFASGWTNPETREPGEDRARIGRWPWTVGAGITLALKWPVDFRVRYLRSHTDWTIVDEGPRLDYRYVASGVFISVGVHIFD